MTRHELAKVHQSQWRWHFAKGKTQESVHHSDRLLFEDSDGHWRQETLPFNPNLSNPPSAWKNQLRLWKRRLKVTAVTDIQLNLMRKHIFLFTPKVQMLPCMYEWTVSWTLPNRSLGPLLGSMCFRQPLLPTPFLMNYFEMLSRVPVLPLSQPFTTPLYFNGYLLLHFLTNALAHLEKKDPLHGTWRSSLHPLGKALSATDFDPDGPHQTNPLLPQTLSFIPHVSVNIPENYLSVLHYDSDQQILTCSQKAGTELQFFKYPLPQPLYKLFAKLQFTSTAKALVLRKVLTRIPDALLLPENSELS